MGSLNERDGYRSFLNSSSLRPAAFAIVPIVKALTGSCRGIVKIRTPSDMTMCLLSRMIRKPAFSKARAAWRCGMPGILPKLDGDLDLANELGFLEQLFRYFQVLPDGILDVRESRFFCLALRHTAWKSRY